MKASITFEASNSTKFSNEILKNHTKKDLEKLTVEAWQAVFENMFNLEKAIHGAVGERAIVISAQISDYE